MDDTITCPPEDEIHVYFADLRSCASEAPEALLSPDESERAGRFRSAEDSLRYVRARCLLRNVLASCTGSRPEEIRFGYTGQGKPFLGGGSSQGVQFSVSHSGDMAAVAIARGRSIGVDIERLRDDIGVLDLARRYFSDTETAAVRQAPAHAGTELFFRLWTRKEALLKASGRGIGGLPDCPGLTDTGTVLMEGTLWQVRDLEPAPGYTGAVAVEGAKNPVRIRIFPPVRGSAIRP